MIALVARLAARDCAHDRRLFLCFATGLAAVLAPLMVIYGLKHGIIDHLVGQLRDDPRMREIVHLGNRDFDDAWFLAMASRPDVAFVIPRVRSLAASGFLDRIGAAPGRSLTVELIPSAAGDPMLTGVAVGPRAIVLSQAAARRLEVNAGDTLTLWITRTSREARERAELAVTVAAVAPAGAFSRDGAFVAVPLLLAIEDWREGRAVPEYGWPGDAAPAPRRYAGFRLFARSIFDVAPLEDELTRAGLNVQSRADDIEVVLGLDRNLSLVFLVVAAIALAGYAVSLASSLWANVERKRRALSVLRLLGLPARAAAGFPLIQGLLVAFAGLAGAFALYALAAGILNAVYAESYNAGAPLCRLTDGHLIGAAFATFAIAAVASLVAARGVLRVEPSQGLRDE